MYQIDFIGKLLFISYLLLSALCLLSIDWLVLRYLLRLLGGFRGRRQVFHLLHSDLISYARILNKCVLRLIKLLDIVLNTLVPVEHLQLLEI